MAVLVSQEHQFVIRRTPSSGDGGVDLLIPVPEGWFVRQVKSFTGRMTASRRRQVEDSLDDVMADPRLDKPVVAWRLTVPIDPTSGEQEWFEELTKEAEFSTWWEGKVFWDAMSARHPHVIDYYFRDGRGRIEEGYVTLLAASEAAAGTVTVADVEGHLERLRVILNRDDPHYRYEFVTGFSPPNPDELPAGTTASKSRMISDGRMLTTLVFERYTGALQDAPIVFTLNIVVHDPSGDIDIRDAFEGFRTYGRALDLPEGALSGVIDAPNGFGGTLDGVGGRISARSIQVAPTRTRLAAVHPDDGIVNELVLVTESVTRGELAGIEAHAVDERGVLRARFTVPPPSDPPVGSAAFSFQIEPFYGKPVLHCLPALRMVDRFEPPYELRWLEAFGTTTIAVHRFTERMDAMPPELLMFLEDVATLQEYVRGTVAVPSVINNAMIAELSEIGLLLRVGVIRGTWSNYVLPLNEGADEATVRAMFQQEEALVLSGNQVVEVEDKVYEIGMVTETVASARLADDQPNERELLLVPGADDSPVKRLGAPDDLGTQGELDE